MKKARILGLFLVFVMLVGICVPTLGVFATDETNKTINYVSIGDSMSSGIGLKEGEPYTEQFAKWLKDQGNTVNHTAIEAEDGGAILSETLLQNIKNNEEAIANADIISFSAGNDDFDSLFVQRLLNLVGFGSSTAEEDKATYAYMTYQNAIELLNNSLAKGKATGAVAWVEEYCDKAIEKMDEKGLPKDLIIDVVDYLSYITASYIVTYVNTIDYIQSVNPDATVIIMPLVNNVMDLEFDITRNGIMKTFNAGEYLDWFYAPINAYMVTYPTIKQMADSEYANMNFYYAELPTDEKTGDTISVETFTSSLADLYVPVADGTTVETYPANRKLCHSYFINGIRTSIFPMIFGDEGIEFNVNDVIEYEVALAQGPEAFAQYLFGNVDVEIRDGKAKWIAQYLGVVDTMMVCITSQPAINVDDLDIDTSYGFNPKDLLSLDVDIADTIWDNAENRVNDEMFEACKDKFYNLIVEKMLIPHLKESFNDIAFKYYFGLQHFTTDLDRTLHLIELALNNDTRFEAGYDFLHFKNALVDAHNQIIDGIKTLAAISCVPTAMSEELATGENADELLKTMLNVYGRVMGDALVSHPNANGHDTLAQALINAYENEYTVRKHMEDGAFDFVIEYPLFKGGISAERRDFTLEKVLAFAEIYGYEESIKCELEVLICDIINRLNHKAINEHYFKEYIYHNATCTEDAWKSAKCELCGAVDIIIYPDTATGHKFTNYIFNNDATCTEDGTETATCDYCDVTNTRVCIHSSYGHNMKDATCTTPKTCERCGYTEGRTLWHYYDNPCDATCNRCGMERTRSGHVDVDDDGACDKCGVELDNNTSAPDLAPQKQNFFVKIWLWIINFFSRLFKFGKV